MGQQVTKMLPGLLSCICVIMSDALLIFVMLQHHYYRLYWRVIQNITGELLIFRVIEMSLGEVII